MPNLDQIILFIRNFIATEFDAELARLCAPDRKTFREKASKVDAFCSSALAGTISRPMHVSAKELEETKEQAMASKPRTLFEVREYRHPQHGELFRCYLSDLTRWPKGTRYSESKYVAQTDDGLKIIASYRICFACCGFGTCEGKKCRDCGGLGWQPAGGVEFAMLGKLVAVRKLEPPTNPADLPLYESMT